MDITYPVMRTDHFGGEDMFEVADRSWLQREGKNPLVLD